MPKFEVYKDKKGETRFRYRASNGEIMFSSEGYSAKASAMKAIASIKKNAANAPVEEPAAAAPKAAAKPAKAPAKGKAAAAKPAAAKAKAAAAPKAKAVAKPKAAAKPKPAPKAKAASAA